MTINKAIFTIMITVDANASIGFGLATKLPNVPIIAKAIE